MTPNSPCAIRSSASSFLMKESSEMAQARLWSNGNAAERVNDFETAQRFPGFLATGRQLPRATFAMGHQPEFDGALNGVGDIVGGVDGAGELLVEAVHQFTDGSVSGRRSAEQLHHGGDTTIDPALDQVPPALAHTDFAVVEVVGLRNLKVHCLLALGHFDLDLLYVCEPVSVIVGDPSTIR